MRRPRGPGGRFLTGEEIRALEAQHAQQPTQSAPQQGSRPQSANGTGGNAVEGDPLPVPGTAEGVDA